MSIFAKIFKFFTSSSNKNNDVIQKSVSTENYVDDVPMTPGQCVKRFYNKGRNFKVYDTPFMKVYERLEDIPSTYKKFEIYYCRVTVPKTYTIDTNFPVIYIVSNTRDNNMLRATYRNYVRQYLNNPKRYIEIANQFRWNSANKKHTPWISNINCCPINKVPKENK